MTRPGHFCMAEAMVSAVRIPYFLAGRDLAVTIPCLLVRSPPTTAGIVLKSTLPGSSRSFLTADQDRKAEFTSI